ncbi:hypothetical protein PYV61_18245, partial [Roseisolibacter sp. H3M3-2]
TTICLPKTAWPPTSGAAPAAALERLDPARLDARVAPTPEPGAPPPSEAELGVRHTVFGMLAGLAEHNAYHGGQIALLKRAVAARPRRT